MNVHPVAALFPMMSEEELDDLAADIKANGLVHPIVLDAGGVLIDGRNRLEGCRRAGVEPTFTTLNGQDPVAFILSSNVQRRHLSKGQAAMAAAKAHRVCDKPRTRDELERLGESASTSKARIAYAFTVLDHAPDLADAVLSGAESLDTAYKTAQDRKRAADDTQTRMDALRQQASDLADLVTEERISLAGALGELRERERKAREYRELTTRQLDNALSVLDPRNMVPDEVARDMAQHLDPSALASRPDLSPQRIRRCLAVLGGLAELLTVTRTSEE